MQLGVSLFVCALMFAAHTRRAWTSRVDTDIKDYCEHEYFFKPKCDESQVILINHARYGRMRKGRCIDDDFGSMGCSMDARYLLDKECSGKRSCEVVIFSLPHALYKAEAPSNGAPCSSSLRGYLEAAYECLEVVHPPRGYCHPTEVIEVHQEHGYLSSMVTEDTGCGSRDSPWWITAEPGQRLRIHLMLFAADARSSRRDYAVVKEEGVKTIRGGTTREALVYTSTTHRVEVTLLPAQDTEEGAGHFLLKFEVFGCRDLPPTINGWMRRDGDVLYMGCNDTGQEWILRCQENLWIGDKHNCVAGTLSTPASTSSPPWTFLTASNAFYITIAIGAAILIGIILLVLGMVYICRRRVVEKKTPETPSDEVQGTLPGKHHSPKKDDDGEDYYCEDLREQYAGWQVRRPRAGPCPPGECSATTLPLHAPPPPPPLIPPRDGSFLRGAGNDVEHDYEQPVFTAVEVDQETDEETGSEYAKDYEIYVNETQSTCMDSI